MSLNFNYSKCVNSDELHNNPFDSETIHPITEALIWNMMAIDMSGISESNVDEVWFRTALLSLTRRKSAVSYDDPVVGYVEVHFTRDDIIRHIGLSTNVSTLTRKQWLAKMYDDKNSLRWLVLPAQDKTAMQMVAEQAARVAARKEARPMRPDID
jgi:hypothetical protein